MTLKPLEEDFRRMGLSSKEIRESLTHLKGEETETDVLGEDTEEDFEDDAYLSDLVGDDDEEIEEDEELSEDELLEKYMRLKKGTSKQRRQSKAYYRAHKTKIGRAMKKKRKTGGYKRSQAKLKKMSKGSARTRRVVSDRDNPGDGLPSMHESLMGDLEVLAESMERDPTSRFDEYVEAFNHIADLGEMAAMEMLDEDEDAALDLLSLSLGAESILREMEEMGGALDADEDEELEKSLADAMEDVGNMWEEYGLLDEDEDEDEELEEDEDEDEDEYEENPFLEAAASLREAARPGKSKGRKVLNPKSTKTKKGKSKWSKSTTSSKDQLRGRADVRNKEALLGYLKQVKAGKVAPGAPIAMSKSGKPLSKGARAAQKMAGK